MASLEGKVAIVTGGGRGLGHGFARRLADLGAKVAVFDIDLQSWREFEGEAQLMTAASTVEEIEQAGGEAIGIEVDVSDPDAVKAAVERVADAWGRIDVLVANAGGGSGSLEDTRASELKPEELQVITARNLYATIYTCTAVAPIMKRQGSGKIITVGSLAAIILSGIGGHAHYAAAKAGIIQYTRYLAQDLGPHGITANCIAPGVTATGRIAKTLLGGDLKTNPMLEAIALRRFGTVEDCANVIEFLATPLSDYVTGVLIPVDGGMRTG